MFDAKLIGNAPINENLLLVPITKIQQKTKKYGIKGAKDKKKIIIIATENLPEDEIKELLAPVQAYILLQPAIDELKLQLYGLKNLNDEVRNYKFILEEEISPEQLIRREQNFCGTPTLYEILIGLLEKARTSPNYITYLINGAIPAEAFLAQTYAKAGKYETALTIARQAYELDTKYNDVSKLININHFGSLTKFIHSLELVIFKYGNQTQNYHPQASENLLRMWIALYERGSKHGTTQFLMENYYDIFNIYKDCTRESENKFRESRGIPRIGEGWISEMELLNLVRKTYPNEIVIHQGNPDWLGLQKLDVYIPNMKIAIEYQGRQHYEPIDFFGGEEGLNRTIERDQRKARLCSENGVKLIYFRYDEPITQKLVIERISKFA